MSERTKPTTSLKNLSCINKKIDPTENDWRYSIPTLWYNSHDFSFFILKEIIIEKDKPKKAIWEQIFKQNEIIVQDAHIPIEQSIDIQMPDFKFDSIIEKIGSTIVSTILETSSQSENRLKDLLVKNIESDKEEIKKEYIQLIEDEFKKVSSKVMEDVFSNNQEVYIFVNKITHDLIQDNNSIVHKHMTEILHNQKEEFDKIIELKQQEFDIKILDLYIEIDKIKKPKKRSFFGGGK